MTSLGGELKQTHDKPAGGPQAILKVTHCTPCTISIRYHVAVISWCMGETSPHRGQMVSISACMQPLQPGSGHMLPPPPPPVSDDYPAWWDEVWASPLDVRRRIFCNRSLNMAHIKASRLPGLS